MEQPMLVRSNRGRAPHNSSQVASCIVDGCNSDLSKCREYHRRHKVCELHSKTPKVTIRGEEQRFCQQCSRFHYLLEFDDAKRSCRKRLDGHNRRRRKPQPDISSQSCTTSQFFSNSNYEVAKFVSSGDPHQAFLSSALGSSCSWSASPVHKTGNRGESFVSSHHQTGSMRSLSDKKIPSSFSFGGSSELLKSAPIQFPFLQEEGITTLQQAAPLIANPVNHHHQTAQFVGTSDHHHSSVRALSLLSSPAAVPESSCSQKLTPLFDPLLPTQLRLSAFDATPSNASVLVSQGMMFQVTRYGDESESSANGNRPLHHHATSFSWD